MPRVPTSDEFQVAPAPAPQVRFGAPDQIIDPGRQAADAGRAMQQAGSEIGRIALEAQRETNQVRINDAMNKAQAARLSLTYDPTIGYVNLKGSQALERPDGKSLQQEYDERLGKQLDEIDTGLGNDAQRRVFRDQAAQLRMQFNSGIQQHVGREYSDFQVGVQDGTIKVARDQMGLAWGDASALEQSRGAIKAAVAETGRLKGWSAQQVTAATVEALSPGHASVIASAVDAGKLDYAREYLKQVNAELTPAARLQVAKVLDVGDFEAKTQEKADSLYAKHKGDAEAALADARSTLSGKEEDAVVQRIKTYDSERVALRERAQSTAADTAWGIYARTGGLAKIPPSVLAEMDGRDLAALRRTATAEAREKAVKTDSTTYYALAQMSVQDPDAFKKTDLRHFFDRLSNEDRKHFIDLQAKSSKPDEYAEAATTTQQISATINTVGLKNEDAGLFTMQAQKALNAAALEKGKKLDQAERQKVLDRLVLEGSVPGSVWGTNNRRLFQAQATGQPFTPKWSDSDKAKATAALQRQGIQKPTPAQVDATLRARYEVR